MGHDLSRRHKGRTGHMAGAAAELSVEKTYVENGYEVVSRRWRCTSGEIDVILKRGPEYVFVEVKKSGTFARAAARITQRQQQRILEAASQFVTGLPKGLLTPMRFDAALVDSMGRVEIRENALALC